MSTLGQLAAGLTHELNNAISVLQHKTEWVAQKIDGYLEEKDMHQRHAYFRKGRNLGQQLSSRQIRQARKEIAEIYGFPPYQSKLIARMNLLPEELYDLKHDKAEGIERAFNYWEIGTAFHDLSVAAKHATHVVRSVKKLAVKQHEVIEDTEVNQTIKESLTLLKSKLRQVDIHLKLGDLPKVKASEGDLVQVWLNLVKNACESLLQANTPDPQVLIESAKDGGFIVVSINDNGPGIPKSMQRKVFQPNVTTKVGGLSFGLGLGLSIVKRLVHNYDGTITLQSSPGKTVFTVFLPINN